MNAQTPFMEWLAESVKYFRRFGYFQQYRSLSDDELVKELHQKGWYGNPDPEFEPNDLGLLHLDETRVWWKDTERDIWDNEYVKTLQELSTISRGAFHADAIEEIWESKKAPIEIRFQHKGQVISLSVEYFGDWLDLRILVQINELIRESGIAFYMHEPSDQTAFIIALTPEEKRKLEQERGWHFATL